MHAASFAHPGRNVKALEVASGSTVADFGAGSGHYVLALAREVGAAGRVYAVDVQPDLLRRLKTEAHRAGLANVETVLGDIARPHGTKLRSRSVDLVMLSNVLFQLEDPRAALNEAHRIAKISGRLAVIDWIESSRGFGPSRRHIYPKDRALRDAESTRFRYTGEFEAGAYHYGLLFEPV